MKPRLTVPSALFALILIAPAIAFAHAVVYPKAAATGSYERYVLRVPNEKTSATIRVELHFAPDLRVTSFEDVNGWTLEVLTDSATRTVGAVWTGSLPPGRFVEFPFMAANPKTATKLTWPAYQTYADGEKVEWTGAEGSKNPASATNIEPAAATGNAQTAQGTPPAWVAWVALGLGIVSLGVALRPRA
jgi:uncharacterized protein YcnI